MRHNTPFYKQSKKKFWGGDTPPHAPSLVAAVALNLAPQAPPRVRGAGKKDNTHWRRAYGAEGAGPPIISKD